MRVLSVAEVWCGSKDVKYEEKAGGQRRTTNDDTAARNAARVMNHRSHISSAPVLPSVFFASRIQSTRIIHIIAFDGIS